jgi:hypothetical protein
MQKSRLLGGFASFLTATVLCSNAHSAMLDIVSGQLKGASGVVVSGEVWNVEFVDGTFGSIFGATSGIDATSYAHALELSEALKTQVFDQSGRYDIYPNLTFGIFSNTAQILTPFALVGTEVRNASLRNVAADFYDLTGLLYIQAARDTSQDASYVYADWEKVVVIPIPAAVWLFGSGLLGLVGMARRKKVA